MPRLTGSSAIERHVTLAYICLRPPQVATRHDRTWIRENHRADPKMEEDPQRDSMHEGKRSQAKIKHRGESIPSHKIR